MGFQVVADYDAINDVVKKINNTNANYKSLITKLETELSAVLTRDVWDGVDADTFKSNYEKYLSNLKDLSSKYDDMASLIVEVSKRYQEADEQFSYINLSDFIPSDDAPLYTHLINEDEYQIYYKEEDKVTGKIDSRWTGSSNKKKKTTSRVAVGGGN